MEIRNDNPEFVKVCKSCGFSGTSNYCSQCGQPFTIKRITLSGLLHDIFHLFTHLDKGFGYTIKKLMVEPGHMQRTYIEGDRVKHQKPFSMFFVCATVAALSRYWIYQALIRYYNIGDISEMNFANELMVIFHIVLLPVYALITYLFFYRSGYNYGEISVLTLYSTSILFLISSVIYLMKFIWPELDTAYIEFPFMLVYNTITYINFFHQQRPWKVALKSLLIISCTFLLIQLIEDFVIGRIF
jgi:hypothetical protein